MGLRSGFGRLRPSAPALLKGAIALAVVVLALHGQGVSASTSVATTTQREASAVFTSDANGLHTSVEIVVGTTERTTDAGVERQLNASIEIYQSDSKRPNAQAIDVAGSVEGEPDALQINGGLTDGWVQLTIPVCGAKPLHNGRLKLRPFDYCFDVEANLRWTGAGDLSIQGGPSDMPVDGCTVHLDATSERRPAAAEGSVAAGGVNFAPEASSFAALSAFSQTSAVTCP